MTEYAGQQFVGIDLHRRRSPLLTGPAPSGMTCANAPIHTLKRNENRVFRLPAVIVDSDRKAASDLGKRCSQAVGSRWSETGSA